MTIGEQLKLIRDHMKTWTDEIKATVQIAEEATHVFSMLTTSPGSPRFIVMFDTESKRGEIEEAGVVDRKFLVIFTRGRTFRMDTGDAILEQSAGQDPFYDLLEKGREMVRSLRFDPETCDRVPDYKGISRFEIEGFISDARQIEFTVGTQLPRGEDEEEES